ncbi:vWA domain-containing protein [uncultured Thiodictyon sp.]|uniref:vWA domain-containing protein n=1 Tax=uncultured Thiodictyon sp. TaxID=1846217 RepID=UPI0026005AC3|nr:vWA domain-containing protein [uncultured Thiodictyon sp.]
MAKIARPNRPLADVNVLRQPNGSHEIVVCFMPDPDILVGEGNSKAYLALDASRSLKEMYGGGGVFEVLPNYVQAVARKLGCILTTVTKTGTVTGLYWAISPDGGKTEIIGEFDEAGWSHAAIDGPKSPKDWGRGTKLLPAIQYGVETIARDADWTIGVIVTDGVIEDESACMQYCTALGKAMADGKRKPLKLVLIGIGNDVDEQQLERFDDMFEGTGITYDLWSHGMVASMKDEADILGVLYGELMDEQTIIAASGSVLDGSGTTLASWADGLPGKFRFVLPKGQTLFTIHTPSRDISQDVSEALGAS